MLQHSSKHGSKPSPAFKGFGRPPSQKGKKQSTTPRSQSRVKHSVRLRPRGGTPHVQRRAETAEDAQMRIRSRAMRMNSLTATAEEVELRTPDQEAKADDIYGPRGLLLVGFEESDFHAVRGWFQEMEPGFRVSSCSDDLLSMPLGEALTQADGSFRDQPEWSSPRELVPHAAMFSGMSQDEYFGLVQYWESTGIKQPIFASAARATAHKPLRTVLLEISKAYARSIKPDQESNLDRDTLRQILRERMEAKAKGEPITGPAFL